MMILMLMLRFSTDDLKQAILRITRVSVLTADCLDFPFKLNHETNDTFGEGKYFHCGCITRYVCVFVGTCVNVCCKCRH